MKYMNKQDASESHEPLISQAKAAEMCGVTRESIRRLVLRQRLTSVEVDGRDLVYLKEVVAYEREEQLRRHE